MGRRPWEPVNSNLQAFYRNLLRAVAEPVFRAGEWRLGERRGWPDNPSYLNLVAWRWRLGEDRRLIEANLSDTRSQGFVFLPWEDLAGKPWSLSKVFNGEVYDRDGNEILESGLFVDLEPWQFHFFRFILY